MLSDGEATASVMGRPAGAASAMDDDAVWAQMATVGLSGIERCAAIAEERGVALVDAPVLGTKKPAEDGQLLVLAAGRQDALERCRPVFDAVARKVVELGEPGAGTRLKVVLNSWLLALVEGVAESIALAEALNVDPARFLETLQGSPMDSPYAQLKGRAIIDRALEASFPLRLARKDVQLVIEAADRHALELSLPPAIAAAFDRAIERGHGDEDMAAAYFASAVRGLAQ
jgi:3-hydroxyisobutyrate dehydrogenase